MTFFILSVLNIHVAMRILVVEDEIKLAEAMASGLKAKGYAVDTIEDGEKALDANHGPPEGL